MSIDVFELQAAAIHVHMGHVMEFEVCVLICGRWVLAVGVLL